MKLLFAIKDENNIVDSVVRKYKQNHGEKVIFKELNNFNAIIKELQQNNSYDRIIVSDDVDEKINRSEKKSKIILERIKTICQITKKNGKKRAPIIMVCKNDKMLGNLYNLNKKTYACQRRNQPL